MALHFEPPDHETFPCLGLGFEVMKKGGTAGAAEAAGVLFRPESEAMGAHRNTFEQNTILDNGSAETSACIDIRGPHHDLVFRDNTIGYSQPTPAAGPAIRSSREATGLKAEENRFLHVKTAIEPRE